MLDINFIKKNSELVKKVISEKNIKGVDIDNLLKIYDDYLDHLKKSEDLRKSRNEISSSVSKVQGDERNTLIAKASIIKDELSAVELKLDQLKKDIEQILPSIPNVVSEEMPVGKDEHDNLIIKVWDPVKGYIKFEEPLKYDDISYAPESAFSYKDHLELGESLDIIDIEQSGKVSGSRFCYLKKEAVLIQDAISNLLKKELQKRNFIPMIPPLLVKERSLFGTSHFPEGRAQVYEIRNENVEDNNSLFLVGSAEPSNF